MRRRTEISIRATTGNASSKWTLDIVSGLNIREEAALPDVVNAIVRDVREMSAGVPFFAWEAFSLTTARKNEGAMKSNERISFWDNSFKNGLESNHAFREMFSTMTARPNDGGRHGGGGGGRYEGFELILKPRDGPWHPGEYDSSASNPACMVSLIASLSVHPRVLSIDVGVWG